MSWQRADEQTQDWGMFAVDLQRTAAPGSRYVGKPRPVVPWESPVRPD